MNVLFHILFLAVILPANRHSDTSSLRRGRERGRAKGEPERAIFYKSEAA